MAQKRTAATTTISIADAQLKALIAWGVADALAERDADRSRNDDDNLDSGTGGRRQTLPTRECTYNDYLKCQHLNFKGTEGGNALTWWNSHVKTVTHDDAYAMTWKTLKKMMTDKYCPRGKIKKLEIKMWNLKVKGIDVVGYNQCFQELALMCDRMFPEESNMIEKYVDDKKISTLAERQAKNKRKLNNNNQAQQQPPKKQSVAIAYTAGSGERKESPAVTNNQRNLTCYECGNQRHYKSDCLELKNQNHGNQVGGTGACGMVHALGGGDTNQDVNNMENDINA
ncbi:reverse transcriptase domain-containing protein [Tanacetum coccineum]|uniref:Reverse transcriptase domain-containing protein n=1 Tax=Tanacetum coccineum TaxID=301880 RepID=A0ABQ5DTA2_9ASTR